MSLIMSLLQVLFGHFLIVNEYPVRHFFIEFVSFSLYLHCSIATTTLSLMKTFFEYQEYNRLLMMYRIIPFKVVEHFTDYPETYVFCGWLMLVYGASSIFRSFERCLLRRT